MSFNPETIEALAALGQRTVTEQGKVTGTTYRERYLLPVGASTYGQYLDVCRDTGVGHHQIVEFAIRRRCNRKWQVNR